MLMHCAIWYHLYNFKNMKNTLVGVLLLVKLQDKAGNVTKGNTSPWVPNRAKHLIYVFIAEK